MNKNVIAFAFGVALSAIACTASAQSAAAMPKTAAECRAAINTEMQNYPKAIAAGVAKGTLSAGDVMTLNKAHESLLLSVKGALADADLIGPECFLVINKLRAEVAAMNAATPVFNPPKPPICPSAGQAGAIQCDLNARALAACGPPSKTAAEFSACMASFLAGKQLNCALAPAAEKAACDKFNAGRPAPAPVPSAGMNLPKPPVCPAAGQPNAAQCDLLVRGMAACGPTSKTADEFSACLGSFETGKQLNCALAPAAERAGCDKINAARLAAPAPAPSAASMSAAECKAAIDKEMLNFANAARVANATLSAAEATALNKAHESLLLSERAALADTNLSGPACLALINKLRAEVLTVNASVATRTFSLPAAPKCPAAGQASAFQCDLNARALAACGPSVKTEAELGACMASFQTSKQFNCALAPLPEKANCEKSNIGRVPAPAAAPPAPVTAPVPVLGPAPRNADECKATISAEMENYLKSIAAGLAKGSLSTARAGALNKEHDALLVFERAALADPNLSGTVCLNVIEKIRTEVITVNAAMLGFSLPPAPKCPADGQPGAVQCELFGRALRICGPSAKSEAEFSACMQSVQANKVFICSIAPAAEKAACDKANINRKP